MEMCYDGALVMPSNYAIMDEEEMTYVEGGGLFQKAVYHGVAFAANCAFNGALGGGTIGLAMKVFKTKKDLIVDVLVGALSKWLKARVVNKMVAGLFVGLVELGINTVGGAIAERLDRWDGKNDNQIYFSRIF